MKKVKKKEKKTEYEVTINVVYNAVSIKEANSIVKDALERHKTACKNEVGLKKTEGNYYITTTDGNGSFMTGDRISITR